MESELGLEIYRLRVRPQRWRFKTPLRLGSAHDRHNLRPHHDGVRWLVHLGRHNRCGGWSLPTSYGPQRVGNRGTA
jgi:hypothetical protein